MAKRARISVKQIILLILLITGIVFLTKCTVSYFSGKTGSVSAEDAAEFLKSYGWEVDAENVHTQQTVIPNEFSEVYERYNALQLKQGYDLTKYKGEQVIQYTFTVKNYKSGDNIEAHVLAWGGKIIGGDLCNTELNGFMKGFDGK